MKKKIKFTNKTRECAFKMYMIYKEFYKTLKPTEYAQVMHFFFMNANKNYSEELLFHQSGLNHINQTTFYRAVQHCLCNTTLDVDNWKSYIKLPKEKRIL